MEFINNDLNTPKALALAWDIIKDKNLSRQAKHRLLIKFDEVFGLNLRKIKRLEIPAKVKKLIAEREKCRKADEWEKADILRKSIQEMGYWVEDTKEGTKIKKL